LRDSSQVLGDRVDARLVCDASGFSRKLTGKFGPKQKFPGWNCDAYWAYFREKDISTVESDLGLDHFDYPATKHMCFPEGWGWFIKLISWHHAPLSNLMDLIAYLIDNAKGGVPAVDLPCIRELSEIFECPYEFITSIGWAVRNDFKFPNLEEYGLGEAEQKFHFFQRRYPTLNGLMKTGYQLLPEYYGKTYFCRKALAYQSPLVAGEGWFAVGNSAGFTNPLISPGINAGVGTAVLAASLTDKIFSAKNPTAVMYQSAQLYQTYSHDFMMPRLHRMNRLWYSMFRDHRLFEAFVPCYWFLGAPSVETLYTKGFTDADLGWLVGAGSDALQDFCADILQVVDSHEGLALTEDTVRQVQAICQGRIVRHRGDFLNNNWGRYLRKYNDRLEWVPGKTERDPGRRFYSIRCVWCRAWNHNGVESCLVCAGRELVA
jgi:hypothetical protein